MNNPRLTLYGMYKYLPSLFDGVILPNGYDRNLVIDEIIERSGDLYPYYQVPDRLKENITHWFLARYDNLERIYRALYAEYNPIENYNREETSIETPEFERTHKTNDSEELRSNSIGSSSSTLSGSTATNTVESSNTTASGSTNSTTVQERSAYDSSDYSPEQRSNTNGTSSDDQKNTTNNNTNGTSTQTESGRSDMSINQEAIRTNTEGTIEKGKKSLESHIHGNIGVTTNQQMILSELDLRKINLYEMIAQEFENKFLVQIY